MIITCLQQRSSISVRVLFPALLDIIQEVEEGRKGNGKPEDTDGGVIKVSKVRPLGRVTTLTLRSRNSRRKSHSRAAVVLRKFPCPYLFYCESPAKEKTAPSVELLGG